VVTRLATVIEDYSPKYTNPISARAGDSVIAERQDDEYPGWWWCRARDGKEGWVPESFLELRDRFGTLLQDYDAHELSVRAGDQLTLHEEVAGWARATDAGGRTGWVPIRCLAKS
jgi:SH3-like domain-containing protein